MVCEWFSKIFKCFKVVTKFWNLGFYSKLWEWACSSGYWFFCLFLLWYLLKYICPNLFCPILKFLSQSCFPYINSLFLAQGLLIWGPELLCRQFLINKLFIPVFFHCLNPIQQFELLSADLRLLSTIVSFTSSSLSWLGSVFSVFCVSTGSCSVF